MRQAATCEGNACEIHVFSSINPFQTPPKLRRICERRKIATHLGISRTALFDPNKTN